MKPVQAFYFLVVVLLTIGGCRVKTTPPELVSISISAAFVGDTITLNGYQFGASPVVLFGSLTATLVSNTESTIRVKVPYLSPGTTQIRVQTDQGTTDPLPFTVKQPGPIITSILPSNASPGEEVIITGDFLNQLKQVRFGDIDAVIKDSTAQKLVLQIPSSSKRGHSTITIDTKGGYYTSPFLIAGTPQITSIEPLKTYPGGAITIKGVHLSDGVVIIGGNAPKGNQTVVTDTEIRTVVPEGTFSGLVTVTVFDQLKATSTDTLQIFQPPVIASFSVQDAIAGDKITVSGRYLAAVTSVTFSNVAATSFRAISDSELEVVVPSMPSSASVPISVSSIGGNTTSGVTLFVYRAPTNLTLSPQRQIRGWSVTISGKDLYRVTDIQLNSTSIVLGPRSEGTSISFSIPSTAISGPVTILNRAGSATTATPLVVIQKAVFTSFSPTQAKPGDRVVIKGDFLLDAQIMFGGASSPAVDDGKNTDTERWVIVPKDASTGPIRIINATNEFVDTPAFKVLNE